MQRSSTHLLALIGGLKSSKEKSRTPRKNPLIPSSCSVRVTTSNTPEYLFTCSLDLTESSGKPAMVDTKLPDAAAMRLRCSV